jgi:hypothetical protein
MIAQYLDGVGLHTSRAVLLDEAALSLSAADAARAELRYPPFTPGDIHPLPVSLFFGVALCGCSGGDVIAGRCCVCVWRCINYSCELTRRCLFVPQNAARKHPAGRVVRSGGVLHSDAPAASRWRPQSFVCSRRHVMARSRSNARCFTFQSSGAQAGLSRVP